MFRGPTTFVTLFLLVQMVLPLHYYAGPRNGNDERFSWRMFSAVRMQKCRPIFLLGEEQETVNLWPEFHEAWITLARRGRFQVVDAMAARLCEKHPEKLLSLSLRCRGIDGTIAEHGDGSNLCLTGSLR